MEEILHHLGWIKPCAYWDKLPINWCRIFSINSNSKMSYVDALVGENLSTTTQTRHMFWVVVSNIFMFTPIWGRFPF